MLITKATFDIPLHCKHYFFTWKLLWLLAIYEKLVKILMTKYTPIDCETYLTRYFINKTLIDRSLNKFTVSAQLYGGTILDTYSSITCQFEFRYVFELWRLCGIFVNIWVKIKLYIFKGIGVRGGLTSAVALTHKGPRSYLCTQVPCSAVTKM